GEVGADVVALDPVGVVAGDGDAIAEVAGDQVAGQRGRFGPDVVIVRGVRGYADAVVQRELAFGIGADVVPIDEVGAATTDRDADACIAGDDVALACAGHPADQTAGA